MGNADWPDLQQRISRYAVNYDAFTDAERQAYRDRLFPDLYGAIEHAARVAAHRGGSSRVTETSREMALKFWARRGFTDLVVLIDGRTRGTAQQYVFRSLANEFASWMGRNGMRQRAETGVDDDVWLTFVDPASEETSRSIEKVRLLRSLATLEPRDHQLLALRFVDCLKLQACADEMGCSLAKVKRDLRRVLEELRSLVGVLPLATVPEE